MAAPSSADILDWFKKDVIPKRTAWAGFSANRIWTSPRALVKGNVQDPNGLCGDAAAYVFEECLNKFGDFATSDGFFLGAVLWKGKITNHIANILLIRHKVDVETYKWDGKTRSAACGRSSCNYQGAALLKLKVLDLYYKTTEDLESWWNDRDGKGGSVTLAQYSDLADL